MTDIHADSVLILDFGAQYTQLIARRVRELGVYSEILPWDAAPEEITSFAPKAAVALPGPRKPVLIWSRTASAQKVPAYVVFADATLEAVAHKRPENRKALLALPGLGPVKAERYGEKLLELVVEHPAE